MAKVIEQILVITVSRLIKDTDVNDATVSPLLSEETVAQLEAVVAELAGAGTLVEIKQA
jgi:hypothetical protein